MDAYELVPHLGTWSVGPGSLQQKLARGLADCIRKGAVHPGIRLPSERSLAQALSISRTTVVAAFDALRESGWLESRKGSGTWVCERLAGGCRRPRVRARRSSCRQPDPQPAGPTPR